MVLAHPRQKGPQMSLKLQTTLASLHGRSFKLSGKDIPVSHDGHIEIEESTTTKKDMQTLTGMQFSREIGRNVRIGRASLHTGEGGAKAFVKLLKEDKELEKETRTVTSFGAFLTLAKSRGYVFTQNQFEVARDVAESKDGPNMDMVKARGETEVARDEVVTPFGTYNASDLLAVAEDRKITIQAAFMLLFGLASTPDLRVAKETISLPMMLASIRDGDKVKAWVGEKKPEVAKPAPAKKVAAKKAPTKKKEPTKDKGAEKAKS